jgi:3',5'-cyclic AMP phosphodiesterase CpdA
MSQLTRRQILATGAITGASLLAPGLVAAVENKPFRVAHLTDMHVQPERRAGEGYAAALESLGQHSPDLLITGGDHIMDCFKTPQPRRDQQWNVFASSMEHTKVPWKAVLGNHDIWAWGIENFDEKTTGYGKASALDHLQMKQPYYSFDAGGWHFVILDSMSRRQHGYLGQLDPQQLEWLQGDLAAVAPTTPTILFSHIPILAACVFFDGKRLQENDWTVPDGWMHRDAIELVALLSQRKVKLAVSGHIHLVDRVDYNGVTFICDGAVCGNWWKGSYHECPEGYGVLDLYPDGRFEHKYVTYGWKAAAVE